MLFLLCDVTMVSLLYVHAKRTGWRIRPPPKTIILNIKNDSNSRLTALKYIHAVSQGKGLH